MNGLDLTEWDGAIVFLGVVSLAHLNWIGSCWPNMVCRGGKVDLVLHVGVMLFLLLVSTDNVYRDPSSDWAEHCTVGVILVLWK